MSDDVSRRLQRVAGGAGLLVAAAVIATFPIACTDTRSQLPRAATPSPKAQASPAPLANVLSVSDSTPILIYGDPASPSQLDGVTWDGKSSGRLANQQLVGAGNPQNNLFGSGDSITDRSGNTVMKGTFGAKFWQATWADDGIHFCYMTPFSTADSAPTTLVLGGRGQAPKTVARVGTLYNQTSVAVAACSVLSDRAVVVQSGGQGIGTAQIWVVELSTGRIVWSRAYDLAGQTVNIVASVNGAYVAENHD